MLSVLLLRVSISGQVLRLRIQVLLPYHLGHHHLHHHLILNLDVVREKSLIFLYGRPYIERQRQKVLVTHPRNILTQKMVRGTLHHQTTSQPMLPPPTPWLKNTVYQQVTQEVPATLEYHPNDQLESNMRQSDI